MSSPSALQAKLNRKNGLDRPADEAPVRREITRAKGPASLKTPCHLVKPARLKTRRRDQQAVLALRQKSDSGQGVSSGGSRDLSAVCKTAPIDDSSKESHTLNTVPISAPYVPSPTPVITPSEPRISLSTETQKIGAREKSAVAPCWRNTTEYARLYAYALSSQGPEQTPAGEALPMAVTVNLGDDVIADAHASGAFASHLQRRLARFLKQKLGRAPNFWAALEISPECQLHIHGVVIAAEQELQPLREALKAFGGVWREGRTRGRQVDVRQAYDLPGWAKYVSKMSARRVRAYLDANAPAGTRRRKQEVIFATADIKLRAKEAWEAARAENGHSL